MASGWPRPSWFSRWRNFLVGIGSSALFAPLIADISHWFTRRRGIAVAVCSSGNYIGGAVWPPIVQHLIEADGWRQSQIVIGLVCLAHHAAAADRAAPPRWTRTRRRTRTARRQARAPRSGSIPTRCSACSRSPASPAASPCRCRRCISSPTAATSATAWRAAPRCCR